MSPVRKPKPIPECLEPVVRAIDRYFEVSQPIIETVEPFIGLEALDDSAVCLSDILRMETGVRSLSAKISYAEFRCNMFEGEKVTRATGVIQLNGSRIGFIYNEDKY